MHERYVLEVRAIVRTMSARRCSSMRHRVADQSLTQAADQHVQRMSRRRVGVHNIVCIPPADAEQLEQRLEQPGHSSATPIDRWSASSQEISHAAMLRALVKHSARPTRGRGGGGGGHDPQRDEESHGGSIKDAELSTGVSMRESRASSLMSGKSSVSASRRDNACRVPCTESVSGLPGGAHEHPASRSHRMRPCDVHGLRCR